MINPVNLLLQQSKRAVIMGIVNVTPDSFSDGGKFNTVDSAMAHAEQLVNHGADILDIGGESTRPNAERVDEQQELDRVIPIIEKISTSFDVPISIDTYKPAVMSAAVSSGASLINDVNALQEDGALDVAAKLNVPVCLMHKQGSPKDMQLNPQYENVVEEVVSFLQNRTDLAIQAGLSKDNIIVDPGIGFGKTLEHNTALLNAIPELIERLACPVLIGVSRKSMIDSILGRVVSERMAGSIGLAVQSVMNGAKIVRVHDVLETNDAIKCVEAVLNSSKHVADLI